MLEAMSNATLEKLVWVLIYAGLLTVCFGIFAKRNDAAFGWVLIAGGAVAAVLGAFLIYLRSLRKSP
jgi:hypothetical protein